MTEQNSSLRLPPIGLDFIFLGVDVSTVLPITVILLTAVASLRIKTSNRRSTPVQYGPVIVFGHHGEWEWD